MTEGGGFDRSLDAAHKGPGQWPGRAASKERDPEALEDLYGVHSERYKSPHCMAKSSKITGTK